jgi:hypothetical protein
MTLSSLHKNVSEAMAKGFNNRQNPTLHGGGVLTPLFMLSAPSATTAPPL